MALELRIGDVVQMKKTHPCGNHLWLVTRFGADIGITCRKCHRHVMLLRHYLERCLREVILREEVI